MGSRTCGGCFEAFSSRKPVVCVCGCGNKAHFYMAWLAAQGYTVHVFTNFEDEAERLADALRLNGGITVSNCCGKGAAETILQGKPAKVSKAAAEVVPQADIVIVALPTGARRSVLSDIKQHLKQGSIVFGMPGQSGFDLVSLEILREELAARRTTVAGVVPKPVNCKVVEWGKSVDLTAFKDSFDLAAVPADQGPRAAKVLTSLLGKHARPLSNFLAIDLHAGNPNMHPPRLMALFSGHYSGKVYDENPLFFVGFDAASAEMCQRISDERFAIWNEVVRRYPKAGTPNEIPDLKSSLIAAYGDQVEDASTLQSVLSTITSFKAVRSPMKKQGAGWTLNIQHRWFAEDVPEGICMYKGIADLAGVKTPAIDECLDFFQKLMGKEYMTQGKLLGSDVPETKSPQAFGIDTLEKLVQCCVLETAGA
eukprot:gnl/TRDRNA2_/TRDRNA2_198898_c0_seq1.p1 gnl/TRDRNA2_/TRDRNA2_198898_c0~~gnl/TRDRNA2_/TRDRNA2_198898_c0_seq1.p1  ORF type:complete len:424 (+),score=82.08 gnl/TRDRNA2_/TRDRNA2_198898_c0_seq1:88-1359(+)